jgi:hypothetical protein
MHLQADTFWITVVVLIQEALEGKGSFQKA